MVTCWPVGGVYENAWLPTVQCCSANTSITYSTTIGVCVWSDVRIYRERLPHTILWEVITYVLMRYTGVGTLNGTWWYSRFASVFVDTLWTVALAVTTYRRYLLYGSTKRRYVVIMWNPIDFRGITIIYNCFACAWREFCFSKSNISVTSKDQSRCVHHIGSFRLFVLAYVVFFTNKLILTLFTTDWKDDLKEFVMHCASVWIKR